MLKFVRQVVNCRWFCALFGAVIVFVMIIPELFGWIGGEKEGEEEDV